MLLDEAHVEVWRRRRGSVRHLSSQGAAGPLTVPPSLRLHPDKEHLPFICLQHHLQQRLRHLAVRPSPSLPVSLAP